MYFSITQKVFKIKLYHLLRIAQVFLKFLPILYLPNLLSLESYAQYGIANAIITISIFFLGMEVWYYYNREIAKSQEPARVLEQQVSGYITIYLLCLPVIFFFMSEKIPSIAFLCLVSCVFNHLLQESVRILIHLKELNAAAQVNFCQSLWVIFIPFGLINDLDSLFAFIIAFNFIGFSLAVLIISPRLKSFSIFHVFKTKVCSILSVLNMSKMLLVGTVFIKLGILLPRFGFEELGMIEYVAVFSFYQSASLLQEFFIYNFVQAKYVPLLLSSSGDEKRDLMKRYFFVNSLAVFIFCFLGLSFSYAFVMLFIDEPVYLDMFFIAIICFVSNSLICLSNYYAAILYCEEFDYAHKYSGFLSVFVSLLLGFLAQSLGGLSELTVVIYFPISFALSLLLIRFGMWKKTIRVSN